MSETDYDEEIINEIVEDAKDRLAKMGIYFEDVSFSIGPRETWIRLEGLSVDIENENLLSQLAEANEDWAKVLGTISTLRLMGEDVQVGDYIWVEEASWGRTGPFVRLSMSDGLPVEELGYGEINIQGMEETLEGLLDYEAKELLKALAVLPPEF